MAENPSPHTCWIRLGLAAWGVSALAYVSAWVLTWDRPTQEFHASVAGQWRYVIGPTILSYLSLACLSIGVLMFGLAASFRLLRPR